MSEITEEVYIVMVMSFVASMSYWQLAPFYPEFVRVHKIDK